MNSPSAPGVRWYHAVFSTYGFWLPNDPRGSWSVFVQSWELFKFGGGATTTDQRRSFARDAHDVPQRREAKQHLNVPPVRFDHHHRQDIAAGIALASSESQIVVHACAIGFDHVHVVTARHGSKSIEQVIAHFKSRATKQLNLNDHHPNARHVAGNASIPSPWSGGCWKVFINDEQQLRAAVAYVDRHPQKEGLPAQGWSFITPLPV